MLNIKITSYHHYNKVIDIHFNYFICFDPKIISYCCTIKNTYLIEGSIPLSIKSINKWFYQDHQIYILKIQENDTRSHAGQHVHIKEYTYRVKNIHQNDF